MSGAASAEIVALLLRALVLDVFNEHDPARRAEAIPRVFAEDCLFVDPAMAHHGRASIEPAVVALHAKLPGYRFRLTGAPQVIEGAGRITWSFGPPDDPARVTGMDIITVRDGRITQLLTFLDPPPGGTKAP